jgi:transketolase
MRTAFIETLLVEAERDPSLWLVTGDLGFSVLEVFATEFPDRYINAGVAEQNMIGIAAGLALSGKNVFAYSIANFATLRCLEQIRNDVCYHKANVTVVGVGAGLSYGTQGYTHHAVEDIAVTCALPNMTVICPGDPAETRWATSALARNKGPAYLRLGRAGEPEVHMQMLCNPAIGKALRLKAGNTLTLVSTGNMLDAAMQTSAILAESGIAAGVVSMPTVKPIDAEFLRAESARVPLICVLEEHVRHGGLAESIALHIAETAAARAKLLSFHIGEEIASGLVGSQKDLRVLMGIDPAAMAKRIASWRQEFMV